MKVELKDFLIGTWNVRSLYKVGHLMIVISAGYSSDSRNKVNRKWKVKDWELDSFFIVVEQNTLMELDLS